MSKSTTQHRSLEAQLSTLGVDGSVDVPARGDAVAFYSQNANGSKVDVFQKRTIDVTANVAADGSATVTQAVTVRNAIPTTVPVSSEKTELHVALGTIGLLLLPALSSYRSGSDIARGVRPRPVDRRGGLDRRRARPPAHAGHGMDRPASIGVAQPELPPPGGNFHDRESRTRLHFRRQPPAHLAGDCAPGDGDRA